MSGHYRVLLAHTRTDKTKLAAAVRGLVQVHKVHVDAIPWQGRVKLGMELQQRFIEDGQAVNPHFGRREGVQPHHHTGAFIVVIGVAANVGDFVRCGAERFKHQFARQFGFCVQRINNVFRVLGHLTQRFRSV
ncbi:hypothetical protein D3C86_1649120 [compost metagenome]